MKVNSRRDHLVAALGLVTAIVLGTSSVLAQTPKTASTADVARMPADIRSIGKLNAATSDGNAPWSFVDSSSGNAQGVDVDLIDEAAKRLSLTVTWNDVQFTAGIPGVQSGRYDLYISAMADTRAREKVVDFVAYSREGSGVIVLKGNPLGITKMDDLCGKRVSVVTGSMFPDYVTKLNASCKTPITLSETADATGPYLAVASGQADATMNTFGVSNYMLKTATEGIQTKLELSPIPLFAPANQGIALSKSKADLVAALSGAMEAMVADGSYSRIMDKWNVGDGALPHILVNAPLF